MRKRPSPSCSIQRYEKPLSRCWAHSNACRVVPVPTRYRPTLCSPTRPHAWCVLGSNGAIGSLTRRSSSSGSATGGSAIKAVDVLKEHGVAEERIIFINLVSADRGAKRPSPYVFGADLVTRRPEDVLRSVPVDACGEWRLCVCVRLTHVCRTRLLGG